MDKFIFIKEECLKSKTTNPIELAISIMRNDCISIHGPEHHVLDGACFMTAIYNAGAKFDLNGALDEMIRRGKNMPGATCGQWGMCGSASSVGAALAIINETGPLSSNEYYKDNIKLVSSALEKIAEVGGPRCCKRNAFLSLKTAVDFVNEAYGFNLEKSENTCDFSPNNQQCIKLCCPFYTEQQN